MTTRIYALQNGTTSSMPYMQLRLWTRRAAEELNEEVIQSLLAAIDADQWTSLSHPGEYQRIVSALFTHSHSVVSSQVSPLSLRVLHSEEDIRSRQRKKNQAARRLLQEWLADESGYDEDAWPIIRQTLEDNRLSDRPRFGE